MAGRKEYTPEYKAKLVIEVLQEERTLSEIASHEGINVKQLSNWKSEFLENAARAFSRSRDEKAAAREAEQAQAEKKELCAKVGQLTLEVDFLKGAAKKMLGAGWEGQLGYKG
ncbi:transposase [Clostridia bacterium]|nr:transposase [Clostridia bacterium]